MKIIDEQIHSRITSDATITALVPGDQIFSGDPPKDWILPRIQHTKAERTKLTPGIDGSGDTNVYVLNVIIYAETVDELNSIGAAMESALDNWSGNNVERSFFQREYRDDPEDDPGFGLVQEYELVVQQAAVVATSSGTARITTSGSTVTICGSLVDCNGDPLIPDASSLLPDQSGQTGKYLTTNGSTASWGAINLSDYARLSLSNTFSSPNTFSGGTSSAPSILAQARATAAKTLIIKKISQQEGNLTEWQDSSSNPLTWVTSAGNFVSKIGLEVQNSSGGNLFKIDQSNPNIKIYSQGYATNPFVVYDSTGTNILSLSDVGDSSGLTTPNFQSFNRITGTNRIYLGQSSQGIHLHDGSGGTGSLMYVRWGDTYSGSYNSGITSAGSGLAQLKITDGSTGYGGLVVGAATTTSVPLTIKAIASQTSNLTEWQDSTNSVQLAIGPAGQIKTNQRAAATTPGTVTGKMPIYDAAGTLLGYVPIYDSIT